MFVDNVLKNKSIYKQWKNFNSNKDIDKNIINKDIIDSWKRSRENNIDPNCEKINISISDDEIQERYDGLYNVLRLAKPFMNSLYKLINTKKMLVRFTDVDGYVLESLGDLVDLNVSDNLNIYKGCNVLEKNIGTNAIGCAIQYKKPIQIIGSEHYCKMYHKWTSSACPVKDEYGDILGVISIIGPYEHSHIHTLGMVAAAAEAIEKQIELNKANKQLVLANKHLFAIMESISEGLICVDRDGRITDINLFARKMLGFKSRDILDRKLDKIIYEDHISRIKRAIHMKLKFDEEEIVLKLRNGKNIACIASITPIYDKENDFIEGGVISFKEAKVILNLINKIVGAEARFEFKDILGNSEGIKIAKENAVKTAKHDTTILLKGESGTGKELFAQSIHNASDRRNNPFIFLNCGAIPRELVASELFGYVEGAFTGAKRGGHPGKFELADGGTIFLDEIGDMPLDTQANLLRVLENKSIVRVGGHDIIPADVRVIAATHKDLAKEVIQGKFRQDLYYRLNVMPIEIPPLRDRKEDINMFIDYFLNRYSNKMDKGVIKVSDGFYRSMIRYDWPGNVRELQNVMQHIINIADFNDTLSYKHIPDYVKPNNLITNSNQNNRLMTLDEVERVAIERTLTEVDWNISTAAKILGIGRSSLYRKIDKYNIMKV